MYISYGSAVINIPGLGWLQIQTKLSLLFLVEVHWISQRGHAKSPQPQYFTRDNPYFWPCNDFDRSIQRMYLFKRDNKTRSHLKHSTLPSRELAPCVLFKGCPPLSAPLKWQLPSSDSAATNRWPLQYGCKEPWVVNSHTNPQTETQSSPGNNQG